MATFKAPNVKDICKTVPDCCANCKHANWSDYVLQCNNPDNWEQDPYEKEQNLNPDWSDDESEIEQFTHCENHKRGCPTA